MITRKELEDKARLLQLNLGQTEKNYLQLITLYSLARLAPDQFVFKGGTALMMLHNLDRFSEDLDFTVLNVASFDKNSFLSDLSRQLQNQDVSFELEKEERTPVSITFTIRYKGPLYAGTRQTTSRVELDFSERESVIIPAKMRRIIPSYQEIPSFYVLSMSLEEIFAEKIRALLTRNKARDLYDLDFLIAKGVRSDVGIINQKLSYYNLVFSKTALIAAIDRKEQIWIPELKNLLKVVLDFNDVKKRLLDQFD